MKHKTVYRWYRLEYKDRNGEWKDAGDVYQEETRRWCRTQMVLANFYGRKVRMVEHRHVSRVVGKVKDMLNGRTIWKAR